MLGICAFNLVAIRANDSDKSEMVTQLLFGDTYSVLSESDNGKWVKIKVIEDGYQGWMDKKLHSVMSEDYFTKMRQSEKYFCTEVVGYVDLNNTSHPIFFGSYLPMFDGKHIYLGDKSFPFRGKANKEKKAMSAQEIIHSAKLYLSTPYLWGGKSHAGIDCSGLVQVVFRSCGYHLLRDAYQQAEMGMHIENLKKAESGDLAFFSNDAGKITHVGILASNDEIIHAHGKVRLDKIDDKGIINGDSGLYSHKLSGIRRIMG